MDEGVTEKCSALDPFADEADEMDEHVNGQHEYNQLTEFMDEMDSYL
jgi:hypothetical protein